MAGLPHPHVPNPPPPGVFLSIVSMHSFVWFWSRPRFLRRPVMEWMDTCELPCALPTATVHTWYTWLVQQKRNFVFVLGEPYISLFVGNLPSCRLFCPSGVAVFACFFVFVLLLSRCCRFGVFVFIVSRLHFYKHSDYLQLLGRFSRTQKGFIIPSCVILGWYLVLLLSAIFGEGGRSV